MPRSDFQIQRSWAAGDNRWAWSWFTLQGPLVTTSKFCSRDWLFCVVHGSKLSMFESRLHAKSYYMHAHATRLVVLKLLHHSRAVWNQWLVWLHWAPPPTRVNVDFFLGKLLYGQPPNPDPPSPLPFICLALRSDFLVILSSAFSCSLLNFFMSWENEFRLGIARLAPEKVATWSWFIAS